MIDLQRKFSILVHLTKLIPPTKNPIQINGYFILFWFSARREFLRICGIPDRLPFSNFPPSRVRFLEQALGEAILLPVSRQLFRFLNEILNHWLFLVKGNDLKPFSL